MTITLTDKEKGFVWRICQEEGDYLLVKVEEKQLR